MNNKINKNLIVVGALALLLSASHAFAYVPGVWDPQWQQPYISGPMTTVIQSPFDPVLPPQTYPVNNLYVPHTDYYQSQPQQVQYVNTQISSHAISTPTTVYIAPVPHKITVGRVAPQSGTVVSGSEIANEALAPIVTSDQGASAAYAAAAFMPHTLFQWLIVILLILAIIIISRKIVRHQHAHELHAVPAH